jgi:GNAT superfamily N-acetyltransferase
MVDDQPVGYAIYAPAVYVPGSSSLPTAPISADAVQLTAIWVEQEWLGGGIGRILVQAMARDLIKRGGIRAVEAFGETRGGRRGRCVVPADFLSGVGFKTQRAHPTNPRMRMDLRSAVTWKDEVEQALERLLVAVRPRPRPAPKAQPPTRS